MDVNALCAGLIVVLDFFGGLKFPKLLRTLRAHANTNLEDMIGWPTCMSLDS